jgi:RNA polymerase sigma-70 factor, ECF subfamily
MKPLGGAVPPPDERTTADANLMRQIATGDRVAFANLYDRFSGPLYATAIRILSDSAEAQDVVHDAFVALWEKAATFDAGRGNAFSFAVTLLRNRAIDRLRMRRRRSELLATSAPSDLGYDQAGEKSADDSAVRADDALSVRRAVAQLPIEQQRALELAFFAGLTQEEIAQKLSEPLGTVKARIRRALLKLRATLAPRS